MPYANKEKAREYQREWLRQRRKDMLTGKSCVRCGTFDDLEFDHIDPTTKDPKLRNSSGIVWSWSKVRLMKELAKCQVLCGTCHQAKTNVDRGQGLVHGSRNGYDYYRCRCQPCTTASTQKVNEYRWRTGKRIKGQYGPRKKVG